MTFNNDDMCCLMLQQSSHDDNHLNNDISERSSLYNSVRILYEQPRQFEHQSGLGT